MEKSNNIPILILILVVVAAGGWYWYSLTNQPVEPLPTDGQPVEEKVDMSSWKTYRSETSGVQIGYPFSYNTSETKPAGVPTTSFTENKKVKFTVVTSSNVSSLYGKDWEKTGTKTIDGVNAEEFHKVALPGTLPSPEVAYVIPSKNIAVTFYEGGDERLLSAILSTLKFTK